MEEMQGKVVIKEMADWIILDKPRRDSQFRAVALFSAGKFRRRPCTSGRWYVLYSLIKKI